MTDIDTENNLSNMTLADDEEELEEEILVHVDFDCDIDSSLLSSDSAFKLIGIDSQNPLMQVGSKVYQGEWRDIIGTSVYFEEDEEKMADRTETDPLFHKPIEKPLKLSCCTRKSLVMSRVFVKAKADKSQEEDKTEKNKSDVIETDELKTNNKTHSENTVENDQSTEQMDTT